MNKSPGISYKEMFKKENYIREYEKSKFKPKRSDKSTLNVLSIIEEIISSMKNRSYQFKPSERIYITKKNGKQRPIGIPCPKDKLVQRVLKTMFEKVYENIFLDSSHGFRPNRNCLTALKEIKKWTGTTWMIEGDIKGYFDNIDHHILANLLKIHIEDKNLIDLYWKLVKAGYIEVAEYKLNSLGVSQGGTLTPILSNIYLHELDKFIEELKKEYNTDEVFKVNNQYAKIEVKLRTARNRYSKGKISIEELKGIRKELMNTESTIRTGIKINYVRYADNFVIGIIGDKRIAEEVRTKVSNFLKENLNIELKTNIFNIRSQTIKFLGYKIKTTDKLYYQSKIVKTIKGYKKRASHGRIKLYVPLKDIENTLVSKGFCKDGKGIYKASWIFLPDYDIIWRYLYIIRGYYNFYDLVDNYSRLAFIAYLLTYSAAHTLAAKHKTSISKIFKKYGKHIKVSNGTNSIDLNVKNFKSNKNLYDPITITNWFLRS